MQFLSNALMVAPGALALSFERAGTRTSHTLLPKVWNLLPEDKRKAQSKTEDLEISTIDHRERKGCPYPRSVVLEDIEEEVAKSIFRGLQFEII